MAINGLRLARNLKDVPTVRYYIPSTDNVAVYVGDAVKSAGSATADGIATVAQVAAGDRILGVVIAVEAEVESSLKYRVASTNRYVDVCVDKNIVYQITEDAVGGALAATNVGQVADLVVGSGNTMFGYSGMQIDSSTAAAGSSAQLKLLGLASIPGNAFGADAVWEVRIHEDELADSANGV
jgi:hypothetical protein